MKRKKPLIPYPPLYFLAAGLLMGALHQHLPIVQMVPEQFREWGYILVWAGVIPSAWGLFHLTRSGTTVIPFNQPSVLVTNGLYRFSRNPMYTGLAFALAGFAIRMGSLSPWIMIPLVIAWVQFRFIQPEEAILEEHFGEAYREYKDRVRRWI